MCFCEFSYTVVMVGVPKVYDYCNFEDLGLKEVHLETMGKITDISFWIFWMFQSYSNTSTWPLPYLLIQNVMVFLFSFPGIKSAPTVIQFQNTESKKQVTGLVLSHLAVSSNSGDALNFPQTISSCAVSLYDVTLHMLSVCNST